jgi:hypothetical protein
MLALRIKLSRRAPYPTSSKKENDGRLRLFRWAMGWGTENMQVQFKPAHILVGLKDRIICPRGIGKKKGEKTENRSHR